MNIQIAAQQSEHRVRDGRGRLGPRKGGEEAAAAAERPLSLHRRGQDLEVDEHDRQPPVLLLADPRGPEESGPHLLSLAVDMQFSDDGGHSWRLGMLQHEDYHGMWIDPNDPDHFIIGGDAGIFQTWDRGGNYDALNNMAMGQFYGVSYDFQVPYRVCGGLQDNGSSCGWSRRRNGQLHNATGSRCSRPTASRRRRTRTTRTSSTTSRRAAALSRRDLKTGDAASRSASPAWQRAIPQWEDSIAVVRGDPLGPGDARCRSAQIAQLKAGRSRTRSTWRCASTGIRRSSSRRTTRRSSTSAATACSSRVNVATASNLISPDLSRKDGRRSTRRPRGPAVSRSTPPAPRPTARSWRWPSRTSSRACCSPAPTTATSG